MLLDPSGLNNQFQISQSIQKLRRFASRLTLLFPVIIHYLILNQHKHKVNNAHSNSDPILIIDFKWSVIYSVFWLLAELGMQMPVVN